MTAPANWWVSADALPDPTAADYEPPPVVWMRPTPPIPRREPLEASPRRGFGLCVWLLSFTATLAIAPGFTLWLAERIA